MSVNVLPTRAISIKPKVWVRGDHVYARTSYPVQAMTLFARARQLHVDRERRTIEIEDVRWWVFRKSQIIPFDRVAYIDSRYRDFGVSTERAGLGCRAPVDRWERFFISLVLRNPTEEIPLFSFVSGGTDSPGLHCLGFDCETIENDHGDQGDHVRFFVETLQGFLQVPVGSETGPIPDAQTGVQYECSVCKRSSIASRDRCWMCGSPVQAVIPTLDGSQPAKADSGDLDAAMLDLDITT